jgi:hypothetical protein
MNDRYKDLPDGFYYLRNPAEPEPVLVRMYACRDHGTRVFGFNTHDGGGVLPLTDIKPTSTVHRVYIVEGDTQAEVHALRAALARMVDAAEICLELQHPDISETQLAKMHKAGLFGEYRDLIMRGRTDG